MVVVLNGVNIKEGGYEFGDVYDYVKEGLKKLWRKE